MAAAVASKGPAMAGLLKKLPASSGVSVASYALPPASLAAARRFFNTKGSVYDDDDDTSGESESEYEDAVVGHRRRARDFTLPSFFSQGFGAPTTPGRGISVEKEDEEALYLKVAMPGLGKEHVKVSAEKNCLVIKGEGEKEPWDGEKGDTAAVPKYSRRVELRADAFKMDKIKAEMKNGVLRVTVPKVKKEERKDVFQVTIE